MNKSITLKSALDNYIQHCEVYNKKGTIIFYKQHAKALLKHFNGDDLLASISLSKVHNYIKEQKESGLKNDTINKRLGVLKRATKYSGNPSQFSKLKALKAHYISYGRLTNEELEAIESNLHRMQLLDRLVYLLLRDTGARAIELRRIKITNIDLKARILRMDETKTGKPRSVYFTTGTMRTIQKYVRANEKRYNHEQVYLFYSLVNNRNSLNYIVKRIKTISGVNRFSPHRMRHTLASQLYEAGQDAIIINRLLGHSDMQTTLRYIQIDQERERKQYDELLKKARKFPHGGNDEL
jgi:integrase